MSSILKIEIAAVILAIIVFAGSVGLYIDFLWFGSMGYAKVFLTVLKTKILLVLVGAGAFFLFAYLNALVASRSYTVSVTREGDTQIDVPRNMNEIVSIIIVAAAALFGLSLSDSWEVFLRFLNGSEFGVVDPVFGRDVGFYVFKLPLYQLLLGRMFLVLIFASALTVFVYLLKSGSILYNMATRDIRFEMPRFTGWAKNHLFILLTIFFVLLSINYRLQAFDILLSSRSDTFFGPGNTDLRVVLPSLRLLTILALLAGASALLSVWIKRPIYPVAAVVLLIGLHFLLLGLLPGIVQEYRVKPNEIRIETPYILDNIHYTNLAFGLEEVDDRMFAVDMNLTAEDIAKNSPIIDNIRLWDPRPLKDTYAQIQGIRLYYDFIDVDVDRYTLNGNFVEVMLSAREINPSGLPVSAQNWINQHLVYTHGYGVVANTVNTVTKEGLPDLIVKDLPPESRFFEIKRPEIYFGEGTVDYVILNTAIEEFDYPRGDENVYTTYQAESGVQLNSYVRKLIMAYHFRTPKILLSGDITSESRILFDRDIRTITRKITPFLVYDRDPYVVISDGGLYWMMDGYTTTDRYPYSTPHSGVNYVRNPVKVVINAYTGETRFYVIDKTDPLIQTYSKIFPDLFVPFSEMPSDLKRHIRYPEDMFSLQATVYAKYHMKDPRVFYNLEDMWHVPNELYEDRKIKMAPYYIITKLPGEEREEFILMLPFTPRNKDNMIAWLYARSDPEHYGTLGVFKFPKQELIFGPMQVEARIDQDSRISEQLTLWGQVGSRVIRGNLLVIPVENSILYVEPLYLLAEQSQLPQLKRVIVAYGDRVVMEENLDTALAAIFGAKLPEPVVPEVGEEVIGEDLVSEALRTYNRMQEALKAGDWALFGEELKALEEILNRLKEEKGS
jgi:hypothetical protein